MFASRAILFVALLLSPAVAAEVSTDVVGDLASPDYATRTAATAALMADEDLTLDQLIAMYRKAGTAEQRQRLLSIAHHHALAQARRELPPVEGDGAMGITPKGLSAEQLPEVGQPAVVVMMTFPGFPAHAHLQTGDLILAVNGHTFSPQLPAGSIATEFGRMVREVKADQELSLTVRRQGQVMTVRLRLAALEALTQIYGQNRTVDERFLARWRATEQQMTQADTPTPITIEHRQSRAVGMGLQ